MNKRNFISQGSNAKHATKSLQRMIQAKNMITTKTASESKPTILTSIDTDLPYIIINVEHQTMNEEMHERHIG